MRLARVIGRVVATRKDAGLAGRKLLVVQPLDGAGAARGRSLVVLDAAGAGAGEVVFLARGREASFAFLPDEVPADGVVAGIVDHWQVAGQARAGITPVSR